MLTHIAIKNLDSKSNEIVRKKLFRFVIFFIFTYKNFQTDYMADLERDYDYKEEHYDFIQVSVL